VPSSLHSISRAQSAGELYVTSNSFLYTVLPNLILRRARHHIRRSQRPVNDVNRMTHVRDRFTHKFGLGYRREYRRTQINKKVDLVKDGQRDFVRIVSQYHDDRVTMARQKLQSLRDVSLSIHITKKRCTAPD
jgi:hypothetical protein